LYTNLGKIPILAIISLLCLPAAYPQSDAPARIKTQTTLVVVPVSVKDGNGVLVPDLKRDEFRIFEDGKEQRISLFSAEAFPLSAVILINNNMPLKSSEQVQKSLKAIAASFGAADEVALMTYDQFSQTLLEFTKDNDQLFTQLKRLHLESEFTGSNSPATSPTPKINNQQVSPGVPQINGKAPPASNARLDDAMYAASQMLRDRGRDRRKIIFLVSDGTNSHRNTMSTDRVLENLLAADISVYAIAVGHEILRTGSGPLKKYSEATGGDYYYASKSAGLERLYTALAEQARNQYTIAFTPTAPNKTKDFHTIEVRVRRPGLNLIARQGYYSTIPH
jgi:VWFA-related protein